MATPLRQSITLDIEQQKRALREAKAGMQDYSRTSKREATQAHDDIGRSGNRMSTALRGAIAGLVAFITVRLIGALRSVSQQMFDIATSAEETDSKFRAVFGAMSSRLDAFGDRFANMAGLTKTGFQDISSTAGAILQGLGASIEETAENTETIISLAADFASFHNRSIEETFTAIRAGITGESEPLKRFGIVLRANEVDARAMAMAGKANAESLTEWERVQARLNIILEQSGVAVGDLERTQNSVQNTARRLSAQWREQREQLAVGLLPAFEQVIGYLEQITDLYSDAATAAGTTFSGAIVDLTDDVIDLIDRTRAAVEVTGELARAFGDLSDDGSEAEGVLGRMGRLADFVRQGLEGLALSWLRIRRIIAEVDLAIIEALPQVFERDRQIAEERRAQVQQIREEEQALRERIAVRELELELLEEDRNRRRELADLERRVQQIIRGEITLTAQEQEAFIQQLREAGEQATHDQQAFLDLANAVETFRNNLGQRLAPPGADEPISPQVLARAEAAFEKIAQATRAAQAATRQEQRALAEVLRAREMIAEIERSQAEIGTERFAEELAFWQRKLALAQEELDKSVEIREAVRQAASASEDFVRRLRAALQIRPTERSVFDLFQRGGGISPDALRSVGLTAEEAERLENSLRGADEATGGVSDALDGLAASVRSVTRFVDLFGDLSEETRMVADGVADVIDNIAALDRLGVDASAIQALPSIIGAVAGVGSIIGGLISAIQSEREEERRLIEALRQNSRALREFSESLFEGGRVGQGFSEEQIDAARALFQQLLSPGMSIEGAGPIVEQLERLGLPGFEEISGTFSAFFEALFNRVLNERPGDIISGRITADDLFQQAIQIFFGGADPGQFADLLPSDFEPIQDLLNRLADSLGEFTNDVEGAVQRFRFMGRFLGVEGQAAVDAFIQSILEIEGITPNLRDALVSLMEIDTSTEEGQAQFEAELRALAERFAEGGEALDGWLGALDADEFEQILEVLFGHISDFGEKVEEVVDNLDDLIRDRLENISDAFAFADRLGLDANTLRNIILENFEEIFSASGITGMDQGFLNRIQGLDLSTPEGRQQLKFWTDALAEAILRGTTAQFGLTEEQARQLLESLDGLFRVAQEDDDFTRSVQIARSITEVQANEFIAIAETQLFELRKHTELLEELLLSVSIPSPLRGAIGSLTPEPIMLPAQGTHQITSRLVNVTVNANGVTVDSLVNEIGERLEEEVYRLERAFS